MADQIIPIVGSDSVRKNVETSELTRADAVVVQRERVAIGDPVQVGAIAQVLGGELQVSGADILVQLTRITSLLRMISLQLAAQSGIILENPDDSLNTFN